MDEDFHDEDGNADQDSTVLMFLLFYKGSYYQADLVETTPDTAFFQVDASFVRKGLFPKNRLDMRFFDKMDIVLKWVHHPSDLEQ